MPSVGLGVDRYGAGVYANGGAYFADLLGNHELMVHALVNGGWKEIGGQLAYESRGGPWHRGVGAGHIPYVHRALLLERTPDARLRVSELRQRLTLDRGFVAARYPPPGRPWARSSACMHRSRGPSFTTSTDPQSTSSSAPGSRT